MTILVPINILGPPDNFFISVAASLTFLLCQVSLVLPFKHHLFDRHSSRFVAMETNSLRSYPHQESTLQSSLVPISLFTDIPNHHFLGCHGSGLVAMETDSLRSNVGPPLTFSPQTQYHKLKEWAVRMIFGYHDNRCQGNPTLVFLPL